MFRVTLTEENAALTHQRLLELFGDRNHLVFREVYQLSKKQLRRILFDTRNERSFVKEGRDTIASSIGGLGSRTYLRPTDVSQEHPESGYWANIVPEAKKTLIKIGNSTRFICLDEGDTITISKDYVFILHDDPRNKQEKSYQIIYLNPQFN